jgi:hypothetical protein
MMWNDFYELIEVISKWIRTGQKKGTAAKRPKVFC